MSKTKKLILLSLALALAIGFIGWRRTDNQKKLIAHCVILEDLSDSSIATCECSRVLGERALAWPNIGGGSKISFFGTGDNTSAFQPIFLGNFAVPEVKVVLEGKGKAEQGRQNLLTALQEKCKETKRTNQSPIYVGIKSVIEHLRNAGCTPDANCVAFIQTDGEEMMEAQIKKAIDGVVQRNLKLPAPIDNAGIKIIFVGLAEINGSVAGANIKRDTQRPERLREVWKSLFTKPENVNFEPYCASVGAVLPPQTAKH